MVKLNGGNNEMGGKSVGDWEYLLPAHVKLLWLFVRCVVVYVGYGAFLEYLFM